MFIVKCECTTQRSPIAGLGIKTGPLTYLLQCIFRISLIVQKSLIFFTFEVKTSQPIIP